MKVRLRTLSDIIFTICFITQSDISNDLYELDIIQNDNQSRILQTHLCQILLKICEMIRDTGNVLKHVVIHNYN